MINDVSKILSTINITHRKEKWLNRKYDRNYYGIHIQKKDSDRFLKYLPLKDQNKLKRARCHVGVPEWPNGMDNSDKI